MSESDPMGDPVAAPHLPAAVEEAGRGLRAPWAASIAGLLFSGLFTAALALMRLSPLNGADDEAMIVGFAEGVDSLLLVGALYLAPFAGIMFLWFIAVIRDQLGDREDRFFATVFFGSGLLFVGLWFVATAVAGAPVVAVRYLGLDPMSGNDAALLRALAYTLLFAFASRAAAVFLFSIATLGLRTGTFPRWFAWTAYLFGLILLFVVTLWDWIVLLLPAWVGVVSAYILWRERTRRRQPGTAAA